MLNKLWAGMILAGVIFGAFNGKMADITNSALDASKEAVTLCITMMGVMSFWTGMMEVASEAGLVEMISEWMNPVIRFLFPDLEGQQKAKEYITLNIVSNILGLGWAATPAGLKAMEELGRIEEKRREGKGNDLSCKTDRRESCFKEQGIIGSGIFVKGVASDEMCTFLVLNISSLQLIPINIIAYRSQYGSVNPTAIVGPGIVATAVSTVVAVVFCKLMCGKRT